MLLSKLIKLNNHIPLDISLMLISLVDNKYSSKLQIFKIYIPKGSKLCLFIKHFCFFNCSPHKMEYLIKYWRWYLVVINKYSVFRSMQPRSPRHSCCLLSLPSILTRKERELKMRSRNGRMTKKCGNLFESYNKIPVRLIHLARKMICYGTKITYTYVRIPNSKKKDSYGIAHFSLRRALGISKNLPQG